MQIDCGPLFVSGVEHSCESLLIALPRCGCAKSGRGIADCPASASEYLSHLLGVTRPRIFNLVNIGRRLVWFWNVKVNSPERCP